MTEETAMTDEAPGPAGPTPVSPTRYVPPGGRMDRWSGAVVRWLTAHGISVIAVQAAACAPDSCRPIS